MRTSYIKSEPIYKDRASTIKQIPGFWSKVLQSDDVPAAVESAIHACDIPVLDFLTAIEITRYEVDKDPERGDPRSFTIIFEFSPNEFFVDRTLEKTFRYSGNQDSATGLASEAVELSYSDTPQGTELAECVARSESFFAFFKYCCRSVTTGQSKSSRHMEDGSLDGACDLDSSFPKTQPKDFDGDLESMLQRNSSPNDDDNNLLATEGFPPGEDIAIAISEDLYPNALKYFSMCTCLICVQDADSSQHKQKSRKSPTRMTTKAMKCAVASRRPHQTSMKIRQSVSENDEGVISASVQKLHDQGPKSALVLEKNVPSTRSAFPKPIKLTHSG